MYGCLGPSFTNRGAMLVYTIVGIVSGTPLKRAGEGHHVGRRFIRRGF